MMSIDSRDGVLHIGGISIRCLADRHGTPLFVYDRSIVDRHLQALRRLLPQFEIYYSVKANPNLAILRHFLLAGCGLEVASAGELTQALAAGCSAENVFFAGPGKTDAELKYALDSGIGEIHVESHH